MIVVGIVADRLLDDHGNMCILTPEHFSVLRGHAMPYILDLLKGHCQPSPDRISLEQYLTENAFMTMYLGRVVKANALTIYRILFHLSYFETGQERISVDWGGIGQFMVNEQGEIIEHGSTVKRRAKVLLEKQCITLKRVTHTKNEFVVHLPSTIPVCKSLIVQEDSASVQQEVDVETVDFSNRRYVHVLLERENHRCFYCLRKIEPNTCELDHVLSRGGNSYRNIVASCNICNPQKSDTSPKDFLRSLLRSEKLADDEFDTRLKALTKLQAGNLRPSISH